MNTLIPTPAGPLRRAFAHPFGMISSRPFHGLFAGLMILGVSGAAQAQNYITGEIQFNGGATLNTGDLATASAFTSIFGPGGPSTQPQVLGGGTQTGDYSGVPDGTAVTFNSFSFPSSSSFALWNFTVGTTSYSFEATSVTIVYHDSSFLDIQGAGMASITGGATVFTDTPGTWDITDTGSGGVPVFTFGADTDVQGNPTPEPTTSALLLMFIPVAWLAFKARRKSQNLISNSSTK
jgi:hypothetical protein